MNIKPVIALGASLMLFGCAAQARVIETNPGIYSVSASSTALAGGEAGARNKALSAASSYCAKRGQRLNVSSQESRPWSEAAGDAQVTFSCVGT